MSHERIFAQLLVLAAIAFPVSVPAQEPAQRPSDTLQLGPERTLDELVEFAIENAPRIQHARKEIAIGDAAVEGASVVQRFNPELEGKFGVGISASESVELALTQVVELSGARGLRIEAARKTRAKRVAELEAVRTQVRQNVITLYRKTLLNEAQVRAETEALEFTRQILENVRLRFEAGEEARTSVIVARVEVAAAQQRLIRAQNTYRTTAGELAAVIGWRQDSPPKPVGELDTAEALPPTPELIQRAYENDPELAVLRATLQVEKADIALQARSAWPSPRLGIGYENEALGLEGAEHRLLFIVGIPLPIWQRRQGEIARAQAAAIVVRTEIKNREDLIRSRILTQSAELQSVLEQIQIYTTEVLPALEDQLDMLQQGFELGELSLLDVMNARDRLLNVHRQYLDLRHYYIKSLSELEDLLGTQLSMSGDP